MKQIFSITVTILCLAACQPVEFEVTRTDLEGQFEGSLIYILQNDIYLTDPGFELTKQLTFSSGEAKSLPVFHPGGEKFAYLNANRTPVIMDTSGLVLEILTQWENVRDIGWSTDGETLFLLINNTALEFYGPPMDVPSFGVILGQWDNIESVDVNSRNELAFTFRGGLAIKSRDPEFETIFRAGGFFEHGLIRFAINNDDLLVFNQLGGPDSFSEIRLPDDTPKGAIAEGDIGFLTYYYEGSKFKRYFYSTKTGIYARNVSESLYNRSLTGLNNGGKFIELDFR